MGASKRRSPGTACNSTRAAEKDTSRNFTLFRKIVSILAIGAMTVTMFWSAVFGMAADCTIGPVVEVVGSVAMEAQYYGR
jgi:hypothetical protein